MNPQHALFYPLIFITLIGLACSLSNPTPVVWALTSTAQAIAATSTAFAVTQSSNYQPLPTHTPIPTVNPPTPTSPPTSLTANGPWLLYPTRAGQSLIALNWDGSAASQVDIPSLLDPSDLANSVSPKGGAIAIRSGLRSSPDQTALYLLRLPAGQVQLVTPLLSPTEQGLVENGQDSRALEAATGVVQRSSMAWSPDGRYLAFIAALDRNCADVYLYDTVSQKLSRMTFSANMNATPFWSPDGHWIYVQEVLSYGNGTAWKPAIVRAIDAQTDISFEIYGPPADSNGEIFLGWLNATTFLSYSTRADSGYALRSVDISHDHISVLFTGDFNQAVFDPKTGVIAITRSQGSPGSTLVSGLYLITPNATQPLLVQAGDWKTLNWSPEGNVFLASGLPGSLIVTPGGKGTLIANEAHCASSPDENWLACWGDSTSGGQIGLRLYRPSGELLQGISTEPVQALAWQPDAKGFFFITSNHLELATFPSLQAKMVDDNLKPGMMPLLLWVH